MSSIFKRAASAVVVVALSACSWAMAQETDWAKVETAARKEGRVVLYTAAVGGIAHRAIIESFEKHYGIKVDVLEARSSELRERIRSEQAAGRYAVDMMHNATTVTTLMAREGAVQPYGGLPNASQVRAPFKPTELWVPVHAHTFGILVNTQLVKPEDEPRSWKDLLDPRWKGKMLADDFRTPGGGSLFFTVMLDAFGVGYHEQLAQQQPSFNREFRLSARRVARGEYPLYIPELTPFFSELKGLPVKLIVPSEGAPYADFAVSMLKNAPHPNATRLLMNFFLEAPAQLEFAKTGLQPMTAGVTEKTSPEMQKLLNAKLLGTGDVDRYAELLQLAKKLYK